MKTPQARRPSQKPAAIRAAAQRLFLRHGLQQTSMDAVAAPAGTTKQTVYRYFGRKERLFVAVLESLVVNQLRPDILSIAPADSQSADDLEVGGGWVSRMLGAMTGARLPTRGARV